MGFEGFVVDDFVPNSYDCLLGGHAMVREANYTHQAMINARLDETFALDVYGDEHNKTWKNLTLNATDLISDEIGDFWYYCATSTWDWYSLVITHLEGFGTEENYNWPISAL